MKLIRPDWLPGGGGRHSTENQIIQSNEKNADKILQWLTTSQISELQTKLSDAKGEISQANQTAAILATIRGNGCPCNNTSCGCANSSCC